MTYFCKGSANSSLGVVSLAVAINAILSSSVCAEADMDVIEVRGQKLNNTTLAGAVDQLLAQQGVSFSAAGGMANLPVINGMMGDRIKVLVDGADITASCANHMNPPLSYVSANQVQSLAVVAGISAVSVAGDNIAGVISVNEISPQFNQGESLDWHSGYLSAQYKSVNQAKSVGFGARVASSTMSIDYQGAYEDAESYEDGHGDKVLDTLYRAQNHALTAAFKDEKQQLAVKLSHQSIPFQGFANQYMDMTDNKSLGFTSLYQRQLENGHIEAQLNWHGVEHEMGFFSEEKTGMMPMNTEADDYSYRLKWQLGLTPGQTLTVGHEYFDYRLEDWWPALPNSMMMGPDDYQNIHDGKRQRIAIYAELAAQHSADWWWSAGLRIEKVRTNTGEVQAYRDDSSGSMGMGGGMDMGGGMGSAMDERNTSNYLAAQTFNALDRARSDTLFDVTLLSRYQLSPYEQLELGLARKNRAPNLYERYSWGVSIMATTMIGWFGDANGYIGDPDLKPETAHTLSATYSHNALKGDWQLSANLWYSKVSDYIDAVVIDSFNTGPNDLAKRHILQLTNTDAVLYGSKLSLQARLAENDSLGLWQLTGSLSTTHGEGQDGEENLYQIIPLQTELKLSQQSGDWQHSLVWQWLASKDEVDSRRLENTTDSYHLVNLESQLNWQQFTLSLAVNNVFDHYYQLPMGGVSIAQFNQDKSQGFMQLPGAGRSLNLGLSYRF